MLHVTRYSPDTCQCIIEYSWDDIVPQDQRVHAPTTIVQRCTAHQTLATKEEVFTTVVLTENPKKNNALQKILDNAPSALYDLSADGTRTFKNGITVSWSWSGTVPDDRILTITVTGITLTTNQKNIIQTALDSFFGAGNVILVN